MEAAMDRFERSAVTVVRKADRLSREFRRCQKVEMVAALSNSMGQIAAAGLAGFGEMLLPDDDGAEMLALLTRPARG